MNIIASIRCVCVGLVLLVPTAWAAEQSSSPPASQPKTAATKSQPVNAKAKPVRHKASPSKVARKGKARKESDAIATPVPAAKLDLTLPKAMVDKLEPPSKAAQTPSAGKPLLPQMFADKKTDADDFQLGGRILNNEMGLPMMRNEGRREVEGAALDFKFRQ